MTNSNKIPAIVVAPVLPIRDVVVFPRMVLPLFIGRPKTVSAVQKSLKEDKRIILVTQRDGTVDDPKQKDLFEVGTVASVLQMLKLPDGTLKVLVEAHCRVRIDEIEDELTDGAQICKASRMDAQESDGAEVEALRRSVLQQFSVYAKDSKKISDEVLNQIKSVSTAEDLADAVGCQLPVSIENKQQLLEIVSVHERLSRLLSLIAGEMDILQVEKRIQGRVKKQMEQSQRTYYLNEQMKAIQKELGGDDAVAGDDLNAYKQRIAASGMSKEAEEKCLNELKKLRMMQPMSAEATVIRGYLDALLDLPWKKKSRVSTDLKKAANVLDADHWGLEKVKERILEYLAVQKRVDKVKAPILCLVGGPGVGKTSLGESIARATGRKFVRMALGGVHDESEIRGHRRTYIGSMPGKVLQSLSKVGVRNPLFLLDEIDKLGQDYRGDPAAALLEVLDPEQNRTFQDHYVDVDFDLSDVMFVATSNSYNIPPALLDRMEVINLSGYTEDEKMHIAMEHLIPKQMKLNGIKPKEAVIDESAIRDVIRYYTREAGVRGLERAIGKIFRKVVREHENDAGTTGKRKVAVKTITVSDKNLTEFLGVRKYMFGMAQKEPQIGQVNGLAWTEVGGDILTVEAVVFPGKGVVQRTGSLGDVMKESVEAARSVVRARALKLGIEPTAFTSTDWHVHFPEGATPKDGPSAGGAITTAIVSAMTNIPVRPDVAMTGEITLRGEILEIGGLKEKLLAALRGGIKKVLIPEANVKDLAEIPDNVKTGMEIIPVRWIDQVLEVALTKLPEPLPQKVEDPKVKTAHQHQVNEAEGACLAS